MSCNIKLGSCAVFCLMIVNVLDVCNAKCDEYFIVFEENPCPIYRLTPLKKRDINWDRVSYPCNSTDKRIINKKCVIEFDYLGTTLSCQNRIKVKNHQTHSLIKDNQPAKLIESGKKPLDEPKNNITGKEIPNVTAKEEFNTSIYDINLIYVYEDKIQNSSETIDNKSKLKDQILRCDYAETVCVDAGNPENSSLIDVINKTLQISINRDKTSAVQPIFTGYFPQSSNNAILKNNNHNFKDLKTVVFQCKLFKDKNCKQNIKNKNLKLINIFINTNYIQNNTITKYPNCTKDTIATGTKLNVKCEDILFTKHNQHIFLTSPLKQELMSWTCQITESDSLSNTENKNKIFFENCFNTTNPGPNKNKYEHNTVTQIADSENKTIHDILKKDKKTENSIDKKEINKDNLTQINPENIITIRITEKENNCSHTSSLNIHEGKIIDLGLNNGKENNLQNNNVELVLSNCINVNSSAFKNKQLRLKAELTIMLNNDSLNTSILQQFNGTPTETIFKERILLRCDNPKRDSNIKTTSNKTILQCEFIDLDYHKITGIEINSNLNPTSNNESEINTKNKIKLNCKILKVNDTISGEEQHSEKNKLYFKNCTNNVNNNNNSKSKYGDINVTPTSDGKPNSTNKRKDSIEVNKTEMPNEKLILNKDTNPENMITVLVTEKENENNCSHKSFLNIDEGKIIDLGINNNKNKILQNNDIELILSNCINVNYSIINETQPHPKAELIITLKNESLNTSDLKQLNGTLKEENIKQRILLRCDDSNRDSSSNTTSNKTLLQCESIDLDLYNITGIEIDTNLSVISNTNNSKEQKKNIVNLVDENNNKTKEVNAKVSKNNTISTNKSVESNGNNKSTENNTKVEVENKIVPDNIAEKKDKSKMVVFNRRKDIPDGVGNNSLALGHTEPEKIMLITLLTIIGVSILVIIVLKICPKKRQYNLAPTREPPDEEETAF